MKIASTHRQYRNVIGESPIADSTYVYWVDTESNQVFRLNLQSRSIDRFDVEIPVVAIAFNDTGGFLLASKQGVYLTDVTFQHLNFICTHLRSNRTSVSTMQLCRQTGTCGLAQ
jgi:sugar lactone lactonase YvrE